MNDSVIYPKALDTLVSLFKRNQIFLCMVFGYAVCRCASWIPTWMAPQGGPLVWHDIGKILGIVASILLVYFIYRKRETASLYIFPCAIAFLGGVIFICGYYFPEPSFLLSGFPLLLIGLGITIMTLQWFEEMSELPLRLIPLAIGSGEALNSLFTITISGSEFLGFFYLLIFITISAFLLIVARKSRGSSRSPYGIFSSTEKSSVLESSPAYASSGSTKTILPRLGTLISWKLVLWVVVYCFINGYISSLTGLSVHSLSDSLGNILPGLTIIIFAILMPNRYDIRVLRSTAFIFIILSIVLLWFFDAENTWIHVLACAGTASCRIFAYSLACIHAHANKVSAIPACAIVKSLIVLTTVMGHNVEAFGIPFDTTAIFALAILLICILNAFFSPFSVEEKDILDHINDDSTDSGQIKGIIESATERGLSQRELTVYALMIKGGKIADISEKLFISKSAVRAHMSRIYAKFDVHNRQEFDDFIKNEFELEAAPVHNEASNKHSS